MDLLLAVGSIEQVVPNGEGSREKKAKKDPFLRNRKKFHVNFGGERLHLPNMSRSHRSLA
jgi:hypothetical protein